MRRFLAAAFLLAAGSAAAQEGPRWGPVADGLGVGSGICLDGETIVCAIVLCEDGALTLGVLETGHNGEQPAFEGRVEVDGQAIEREMRSRLIMDNFLHVRTAVEPAGPLWQKLRAGNRLSLPSSPEGDTLDYSLRGSAVELDRVAAACR